VFKGFKEFLFRGNIVDLAVAVVIGTAFVALVTAFSAYVINPIIAAVGGASSLGLGFAIRDGDPNTFVDIGAFLTACITFAITAAVVYFVVVVPLKKVTTRMSATSEPTTTPPDLQLLGEIRDLLAAQQRPSQPPPA